MVRSCSSACPVIGKPPMRAFCPQVCTRAAGWPRRVPAGTVFEGGESAVNLEPVAPQYFVAEAASGSENGPLSGLERHRAQQEGGQVAAVGVFGRLARRLRARLAARCGLVLTGLRLGGARGFAVRTGLRLAVAAAGRAGARRDGCARPRAAGSRAVSAGAGSPIQGMVWPISRSMAATALPSIGATMVMAVPLKPARPVRPMRWT